MKSLGDRLGRLCCGWRTRVVPACLIVALTALIWSPYDLDHPLPGGGFHRVTRGGPRLELAADVPVHDVDLAAPPGAQHGDSLDRWAGRLPGRRVAHSPLQWLAANLSSFSPDDTVVTAIQTAPQVLQAAPSQTPRDRAPPTF